MTPLEINVLGGLLNGQGIDVNAQTTQYIGLPTVAVDSDISKGKIVSETVLNYLMTAMFADEGSNPDLYTIGANTIPAFGNFAAIPAGKGTLGQRGFLNFLAKYARTEFQNGNLPQFITAFQGYSSWIQQNNAMVNAATNGKTFLAGTYSGMEDLITADIMGVNKDTKNFSTDLTNLGVVLSFPRLNVFGSPQSLLLSMISAGAIFNPILVALSKNFTEQEVTDITTVTYAATPEQERKLYNIFLTITGQDLRDILNTMFCVTKGFKTLADLLNPVKLFPLSYATLTMPFYTPDLASAKMYVFIYRGGATNPQVEAKQPGVGSYLDNILPTDIAQACGAFRQSMMQIKNILRVNYNDFCAAVNNIETLKGVPLTREATPVNQAAANTIISQFGGGSGPNGTFTMCDFFGTMSGTENNPLYVQIYTLMLQMTTPELIQAYSVLASAAAPPVPDPLDPLVPPVITDITTQIAAVNQEIAKIQAANPQRSEDLNTAWNNLLVNYVQEYNARSMAYPDIWGNPADPVNIIPNATKTSISTFVTTISNTYAFETLNCESSEVLENISQLTNITGQSIVALMRRSRNAARLNEVGIPLDDEVSAGSDIVSVLPMSQPTLLPGQLPPPAPQINPLLVNSNQSTQPNSYSPDEAAADVERCNCDCWVE